MCACCFFVIVRKSFPKYPLEEMVRNIPTFRMKTDPVRMKQKHQCIVAAKPPNTRVLLHN